MLVLGSPKGLLDSEMACVLLPPQGPRGGCGEGGGEVDTVLSCRLSCATATGPHQLCLLHEALGSPGSTEAPGQVEGSVGGRGTRKDRTKGLLVELFLRDLAEASPPPGNC